MTSLKLTLQPERLSWLLGVAHAALTPDPFSPAPFLANVRLTIAGGLAWAAATDRYVAAIATAPAADEPDVDVLIPAKAAAQIHRTCRGRRGRRPSELTITDLGGRDALVVTLESGDLGLCTAVRLLPDGSLYAFPDIAKLLVARETAPPVDGTWMLGPAFRPAVAVIEACAPGRYATWTTTKHDREPDPTWTTMLLARASTDDDCHLVVAAMTAKRTGNERDEENLGRTLAMPAPPKPLDDVAAGTAA